MILKVLAELTLNIADEQWHELTEHGDLPHGIAVSTMRCIVADDQELTGADVLRVVVGEDQDQHAWERRTVQGAGDAYVCARCQQRVTDVGGALSLVAKPCE